MKRRAIAVAVVVAVVCAGLLGYDFVLTSFWDGKFPLEVHVEPDKDRPFAQVSYCTTGFPESDDTLLIAVKHGEFPLSPVADFDGERFTVNVRCWGQDSGLGRELGYGHEPRLVLKFEYADGRHRYKVVEIPDGRQTRRMSVAVP
jgi:hypothetical protein